MDNDYATGDWVAATTGGSVRIGQITRGTPTGRVTVLWQGSLWYDRRGVLRWPGGSFSRTVQPSRIRSLTPEETAAVEAVFRASPGWGKPCSRRCTMLSGDGLNATLALALAPLVGNALVYELGPCPQGHGRTGQVSGDWCHDCVHQAAEQEYPDWDGQDGWCEQMRRLMEADATIHPEWRYQRTPQDFTDPAVLLAVIQALGHDHALGMVISRLAGENGLYWAVRVRWMFQEYRATGDDLGTVMAEAWSAALEDGYA